MLLDFKSKEKEHILREFNSKTWSALLGLVGCGLIWLDWQGWQKKPPKNLLTHAEKCAVSYFQWNPTHIKQVKIGQKKREKHRNADISLVK